MVFEVSMGSCVETGAHPDFPKHTLYLQETADVALCLQPCAKIFVFCLPMQNGALLSLPRTWQEVQVTCHDIT